MLHSIGPRSGPENLVGLLLECHQRIRTFARVATELGQRSELPEADVVDACRRCERYFVEALPLHVEDEEQSLLPRLRGSRKEVDDALSTMHAQHVEHGPLLRALLESLHCVQVEPGSPDRREQLRVVATRVALEFEKHLVLEEQVIFPAIASDLSQEVQMLVIQELRARRRLVA